MVFVNVIFQLICGAEKYLGLITYNEMNYYDLYKNNNESEAIKIIVELQLDELNIVHNDKYIITKYYANNICCDVIDYSTSIFDFIINHEKPEQYLILNNRQYDYKRMVKK